MSNVCECSNPGWCIRHNCKKTSNLVKLCQQHGNYWEAWESGTGPGQLKAKTLDPVKQKQLEERKERVLQSTARVKRVIDWVSFFKHESDIGLGDSLVRVIKQSESPSLRGILITVLKSSACNQDTAARNLNAEHPYNNG